MNYLLDQGLARSTVEYLREMGIESEHVGNLGMAASSDSEILDEDHSTRLDPLGLKAQGIRTRVDVAVSRCLFSSLDRNAYSSPMCTSQLRRLYLYCGSTHQKRASQEEKEATQ